MNKLNRFGDCFLQYVAGGIYCGLLKLVKNISLTCSLLLALLPAAVMAQGVAAQVAVTTPVPLAVDDTAAAKLLGLVLDTYMPQVLHEDKGVAWMGGARSVKVTKAGKAALTSDANSITIVFPLHTVMAANINTQIAIVQINARCQAQFTAPARVKLNIDFAKSPIQVKALIDVVVPPTSANCEGYQLSVQALLQTVIDQQKAKWQNDIQQQITDSLSTVGL